MVLKKNFLKSDLAPKSTQQRIRQTKRTNLFNSSSSNSSTLSYTTNSLYIRCSILPSLVVISGFTPEVLAHPLVRIEFVRPFSCGLFYCQPPKWALLVGAYANSSKLSREATNLAHVCCQFGERVHQPPVIIHPTSVSQKKEGRGCGMLR